MSDDKSRHIYRATLSPARLAQLVTDGLELSWNDQFREEGTADVVVKIDVEDLPEHDEEDNEGDTDSRFKIDGELE